MDTDSVKTTTPTTPAASTAVSSKLDTLGDSGKLTFGPAW